MKEKGMTKKELISKSGISSFEYDLMKNKQDVSLSTLRKICKLLNEKIGQIIEVIIDDV